VGAGWRWGFKAYVASVLSTYHTCMTSTNEDFNFIVSVKFTTHDKMVVSLSLGWTLSFNLLLVITSTFKKLFQTVSMTLGFNLL
jgi:hypothetical protein